MASAKDALRASLLSGTTSSSSTKDAPPDGVLTPTPDTPGEWRSSKQSLDCVPTTSTYLEEDDDGERPRSPRLPRPPRGPHALRRLPADAPHQPESPGRKPNELFGKFTWKIERFSEISKRELRSAQFEVGDYKWWVEAGRAGHWGAAQGTAGGSLGTARPTTLLGAARRCSALRGA